MIERIGYKNFILGIYHNCIRQTKLSRCCARLAKIKEQPVLIVENLHIIENAVHDINMAVPIHGHALGAAETARAISRAAKSA